MNEKHEESGKRTYFFDKLEQGKKFDSIVYRCYPKECIRQDIKAIVTTNYPTAKDQILNEEEGLIVDMNPEGIADGVKRLVEDKKLYEHIHTYLVNHEYGNSSEIENIMSCLMLDGYVKCIGKK